MICWPINPDHHCHHSLEWQVSSHWGYPFQGDRGGILIDFSIYWAKCLGWATSFLSLLILLIIAIRMTLCLQGDYTRRSHWRGSLEFPRPNFSLNDTVDNFLDSIEDKEWGRVYGDEWCRWWKIGYWWVMPTVACPWLILSLVLIVRHSGKLLIFRCFSATSKWSCWWFRGKR